jgi:hypothetical protein
MATISMLGFPVRLGLQARQHRESLLREFAIIASRGGEAADVPKRLLEISLESDEIYTASNQEVDDAVDRALARGLDFIDIELTVPDRIGEDTADTVNLLAEVYEYCRSGDLLTTLPTPVVSAYWIWVFGELVRQSNGLPPSSWASFEERFLK